MNQDQIEEFIDGMSELEKAEFLEHLWQILARDNQLLPLGDWTTWIILAGRGFGKTRAGAEAIRDIVATGQAKRIALVGRTAADVRDVMINGESGIMACSQEGYRPEYKPSLRSIEWPNGSIATTYSAEEPDLLRGPQHDFAWVDELAAHKYSETWDMLQLGLRLGKNPRSIITTTPKPKKIIKDILNGKNTIITRGSTYENLENLPTQYRDVIIAKYEGTTLGRQELNAEVLEEIPGALWQRSAIDSNRVKITPELKRVVVAIDPAVTSGKESDETGIVVCGIGVDGLYYILADLSGRMSPDAWARKAIEGFVLSKADRIVAETNNGGDLVEHVLRSVNKDIPYKKVHASRGKTARAEPIAALYEQGKVKHCGVFSELEDQMCSWVVGRSDYSPDRVDALVWGLTELSENTCSVIAPIMDGLDMGDRCY